MNAKIIAERVTRTVMAFECQAGEDWEFSDRIKKLIPQVIQEIRRQGGSATASGSKITVSKMYVDEDHAIPLEIDLYEGSYYPGKVIVNAYIQGHHPLPVQDRQPFDAKKIVQAVIDAFMSLVEMGRGR